MLPYLIISVIAIFFAILSVRAKRIGDKKTSKIFFVFSFLALFIFSAIRYNVWTDYLYTYVPEYYRISLGLESHYEPLFFLLNKFVYIVFNNVDWLFIITSFIVVFFTFLAISQKSVMIPLSVFLFLGSRMYFLSFDQIRQYITISIFLYNIKNIENDNFKQYFLLTIISILIHKTALLFIPVYFFNRLNLDRKKYIILSLLVFVMSPILNILCNYFAEIFYGQYFTYGSYIDGTRDNISVFMILAAVYTLVLSIVYYNKLKGEKYYKILMYIQLLLLYLIFGTLNLFDSYRIVSLFLYTSILLIPKIISVEKNEKNKIVLFLSIVILYSVSGIIFLRNASEKFPYTTIFER